MSLLRQITDNHFRKYLENYPQEDLALILVELLMVTRDLVEHPVFPADWAEMILLQNRYSIIKLYKYILYI